MRIFSCSVVVLSLFFTHEAFADDFVPPNIIFIMADDLGYGDLGCYGQALIATPRLDQMAEEGMRFTQFYAGSTVCAPSRSVLMTGLHMGHTHVRGNGQGAEQSLRDQDFTVAELLHEVNYTTGLFGKWGLGDAREETAAGLPRNQGFDRFYGYLNQVHAHNYYPTFLWLNEEQRPLRNIVTEVDRDYGGFRGGWATERIDYSHDLIMDAALTFIENNKETEFFLYLALTIPHANNEGSRGTGNGQEVPDFGEYADRDWSDQNKGQAAMISRMDRDVGRVLDLLQELDIAEGTLVIFTSDNGPHNEGGHTPELFDPAGPLRGMKRDLYEGGIRVPFIAWCPGTVPAGTESDHIGYFGDLMATAADLAKVDCPDGLDSISFLPEIMGVPTEQQEHNYLYWEFYERGGAQAVRQGDWKAIRTPWGEEPTELYDLRADIGEAHNIAAEHPDIVETMEHLMNAAHSPHPNWAVSR